MSSSLSPSYMTMSAVKHAIATNLKSKMPGDLVTNAITPLLNTVNEWSTQIPAMLEGGGSSSSANLIFAIRKELFVAPAYTQCVLGTSPNNLPASFGEFLHFIQKGIEAQKSDKDPVATKVNLPIFASEFPRLILNRLCLSRLVNGLVVPLNSSPSSMTKRITSRSLLICPRVLLSFQKPSVMTL